jgi:predicted enzyme related to lactoylglutathione lyase
MTVTNVLAIALVSDFDSATSWYRKLLDRAPDRLPMPGSAVWQLSSTGALQINHAPDRAGGANIVIGICDVDALVASCNGRGFELTAETDPSRLFRLAPIADPDGNMVIFAQDLGDAAVNQPST